MNAFILLFLFYTSNVLTTSENEQDVEPYQPKLHRLNCVDDVNMCTLIFAQVVLFS